jgi:hypothetical protein
MVAPARHIRGSELLSVVTPHSSQKPILGKMNNPWGSSKRLVQDKRGSAMSLKSVGSSYGDAEEAGDDDMRVATGETGSSFCPPSLGIPGSAKPNTLTPMCPALQNLA